MDLTSIGLEKIKSPGSKTIAYGILQIDALNMTSIQVSNFEESLQFYCQLLGFELVKKLGRGFVLRQSAADLEICLEPGANTNDIYLNPARTVFNFHSTFGILKIKEVLIEQQIAIFGQNINIDENFASIQFSDPSGNLIEISGCP
jgi:catechol 2,3-dioxygenase-like lactoylglutathione lyase family enzyme